MSSFLNTPIEYLKGVGPSKGEVMRKEFEIATFRDLLYYYPFRYVDRSVIHEIREINFNTQYIQLKGRITYFDMVGTGRGRRLVAGFVDGTGEIQLVWFQGANWIERILKLNTEYILFGKPNYFNGDYNIPHPEMELASEYKKDAAPGLQPVYPTTEKAKKKFIDSRAIQKMTHKMVEQAGERDIPEYLPDSVLSRQKLMTRYDAMRNIHFPKNEHALADAQFRIKFDELFQIQLKVMKLKANRSNTVRGFLLEKIDHYFDKFYKERLPFSLTDAQKRVLRDIRRDTLSGKQMNRLLQGDVGSGKTIVALLTMLMAIDNGFQACMMAPTEILAQQHYASIEPLVKGLGLEVVLLTGSVKGKTRNYILNNLKEGNIHIVVGTHALIEPTVEFKNLGMVVIDEQHRFGVEQRSKLWAKNVKPPHVLVMTATPIPRTLAMTVYGDLDVSVIDELPPGRKAIRTVHRTDSDRLRVFGFVREQIAEGRQIYFVYPMIEDSEESDLKNLMDGYESLSRAFPKPGYQISIVHGRMKPQDKDYEMQRFVRGETQIMIATTVIEVGVNVPNASVMVIENTERFGLSQLHQLRGRVGRGASQSFCILMTGAKLNPVSKKRVEVLCATNDGFVIAEEDLKLRGPGDLDGTRQSGAVNLRIADLSEDVHILDAARQEAFSLIDTDPDLAAPDHQRLRIYLETEAKDSTWSKIS
ncbi:MAG: ATP-dependent DNA helicase RecG [Bacteroidetes bacterium]|nr:ATP-dependent DNA helicase RecG [Bacteroidota bacterium]